MSDLLSDPVLLEAAQAALDAAARFREECTKRGKWGQGAVRWLEGSDGSVLIFTRGEYRRLLLFAIPAPEETRFFQIPPKPEDLDG